MSDPVTSWVLGELISEVVDGAGSAALRSLMSDRMAVARERLVARMSGGKPWAITEDQAAASLFAYFRAAEEGVARRNLDLMAQALASMALEPEFAPDEFRRHARALADLSYDEINVLAAVIRVWRVHKDQDRRPASGSRSFWEMLKQDRLGEEPPTPKIQSLTSVLVALQRTGWIVAWPEFGGGIMYIPSPALDVIARLVDLDACATG